MTIHARSTRWRCRNEPCERRIFAERMPDLATPFARRTTRLAGIVRMFGHAAGGRLSERLMGQLGMPVQRHQNPTQCKGKRGAPTKTRRRPGGGHR